MTHAHEEPPSDWKEQLAARKDYFDAKFADVYNRADRLQDGLDKAERQLQIALIDAEKRVNEKFEARDRATDKAAVVLDERLSQMNQFRDQIIQERRLYVTTDKLELAVASLKDQMDIVKRSLQLAAGKDAGINRAWGIVVVIASLIFPIIVTVAGKLMGG